MPEDYKVGYKQPPKAKQFRKGESGNPKGRPKNTRNLKTDLAEELTRRISITVHGRAASVTAQKALMMSLIAKAIKGDTRAAAVIINLVSKLLEPDAQLDDAMIQPSPGDQEIIEAFLKRHLTSTPSEDR